MRNNVTCGIRAIALVVGIVSALLFLPYHRWASENVFGGGSTEQGQTYTVENNPEGVGPAFPAYWETQDYWVAEGCPVSNGVKAEAEKVLAVLDADNISKTAIVCMPQGSVSVPGEWAKRFSKYYTIGNADGPRKDNGFVWLILYDEAGKTEIHMAIGDGMQKLGAYELGNVMRAGQDSFNPSLSQEDNVANAIMTITRTYDSTARANIEPFEPTTPLYGGPIEQSSEDVEAQVIIWIICGVIWLTLLSEPILAIFVVLFGASWAWHLMDWPFELLMAWANSKSTGNSRGGTSESGSSGKTTGGSTRTTRSR